jgi:SAM-dependent methyltransferase
MMVLKSVVRGILNKLGLAVRRLPPTDQELEASYIRGGRRPWSPGYAQAKENFIDQVLTDEDLMDVFLEGGKLPAGFGVALDERCIEYPWIIGQLAHLRDDSRILDAGSALNWSYVLDHILTGRRKLHILTLFPESRCFWDRGVSYLYEDLRDIPVRDDYYDVVVCISTLEHVGFDNSIHTGDDVYSEHRPTDFLLAVNEMHRVLRPGGALLLTVPFGVRCDLGFSQQFDRELLHEAINGFGESAEAQVVFYRYTAGGWHVATADECAECEYVHWIARAWLHDEWPPDIPLEPDRAAAARAVACVKLKKPISGV